MRKNLSDSFFLPSIRISFYLKTSCGRIYLFSIDKFGKFIDNFSKLCQILPARGKLKKDRNGVSVGYGVSIPFR